MALTSFGSRAKYLIPDSLTQSAGVITAVVNGVSYQVTLSGLTAVTLYYLHLNNGVLVQSTLTGSAYRASNPSSILVGAFYSNGLASVAFGAFCTIEGVPQTTSDIPYDMVLGTNTGTVPVFGTGGTRVATFSRKGDCAGFVFTHNQTVGGSNGTGTVVLYRNPSNIVLDNNKRALNLNGITPLGTSKFTISASSTGATTAIGQPLPFDLSSCSLVYGQSGETTAAQGSTNYGLGSTTLSIAFNIYPVYPVVGWDIVPLKDL